MRVREWIPFPKDHDLHSAEFRWKSYKEVEPTATSNQHDQGAPQQKQTDRANRVRRQWEARGEMCTFVTSPEEAALLSILFPQSHHDTTSHFIATNPITVLSTFSSTPLPSACCHRCCGLEHRERWIGLSRMGSKRDIVRRDWQE